MKIKNVLIYPLALLSMQLSCTNDNEETPSEASIYKKWYNKEEVVDGEIIPYDGNESCGKDYIEFYDVNKYKSIDIDNCVATTNSMGTFTRTGNTISVIDPQSGTDTYEIVELTETNLSVKYSDDYDGDGTLDSVILKFTNN